MTSKRPDNDTPKYDESLCAYQRAFRFELSKIVQTLSLTRGNRVLDVPCGNGFYSRLLADRLGSRGRIACVDISPSYLSRVRQRLRNTACSWKAHRADAYKLPFPDNAFDLAWCAQSLISLDDPL